ncbi:MAG: PQQ-binding-like beta-propeller repeat protein [Anaerolineaceae bacterium]|nr:PQQ-binding-like beta-propeller repeat protein [Anaerolineaceae bacterium]
MTPGIALADRYLVEQVIGVGGMGAVYRARDLHFPNIIKLVAVKEMTSKTRDAGLREVIVRNFEREANIVASLNHPSIPRVYDFFIHDEHAYLVMEYILGKDLEATLDDSEDFLPEQTVVAWAIELCEVLEYLHSHTPDPIIFRDIKPSNIMINQFNHVVLVDFGIARGFRLGQKGTMMGTEGYSPPEQYRGEASPLVDIYALGATLHHLLTRCDPQEEPPFTFTERPIREKNPNVSLQLDAIVMRALEYLPENRFQSAAEMKRALGELNSKTDPLAIQPIVLKHNDPSEDKKLLWSFQCEDEIRGSPACQNGIVYVGALDNNLYAVNALNGSFLWKYPTQGSIVGRPVAKDYSVYFGSEDSDLHVIAATAARPIWTYHTGGFVRSSPCLSDTYIFIGSDDGYLHCVSQSSGRRVWRFQAGSPVRSTPAFRDGLVFFGSEAGDFYCLDLFGTVKWHIHAKRAITSSPLLLDELVIFGSMDSTVYAIDAQMGWEVWRYRLGRGTISSPCTDGVLVFEGAIDGLIYAIDSRTTREAWTFRTEHQVTGSPIFYNNLLFCGSVDGNLYCLESRTGRQVWKFLTEKPITGNPLIVDDVLYFGSTDRRLYAIGLD